MLTGSNGSALLLPDGNVVLLLRHRVLQYRQLQQPLYLHTGDSRVLSRNRPIIRNARRGSGRAPRVLEDQGDAVARHLHPRAARAGRRQLLVDNLPTSKTSGVFMGLVELKGRAESSTPLKSQFAEVQCVWFRYTVKERSTRQTTETTTNSDGSTSTSTTSSTRGATSSGATTSTRSEL